MKVLVHICCAPCSVMPVSILKGEGHQVKGFFYNPNIHPYREWKHRMDILRSYAGTQDLDVVWGGEYGLVDFLKIAMPSPDKPERCRQCYRMRLCRAAEQAREEGADAFTSTLLISPYQGHDVVLAEGERAGRECGIEFLYRDFRPHFEEGMTRARTLGLYVQPYCGCIFSEQERYDRSLSRRRR